MRWNDMKAKMAQAEQKAPESGYLLAYTRSGVIFQSYASLDALDGVLQEELLELHLFDRDKEYRAIASASRRSIVEQDVHAIIHVADFSSSDKDYVYQERIKLEPSAVRKDQGITTDTITVLNHISYDEFGMAQIDDYRLMMEA